MKCHPLRWIWGLIPLAVFSWLAALAVKAPIERDLTDRVNQALSSSNLGWAKVVFDGRDGVLSGHASEDDEPSKAIRIANDIYGVRTLEGQVDLLRKVDPFLISALTADNVLTLSGFVANEAIRKSVMSAAKAQFPKFDIVDKLEFARGSPLEEVWLNGVRFGLRQLAGLKSGTAELKGLDLSVSGEAQSAKAYADVVAALGQSLPQSIKSSHNKITPPVVASYDWSANLGPRKVTLTGVVPNEKVRDALVAHAKSIFDQHEVVDRMEFGAGAPENWERALTVSLDQLARLQDGVLEVKPGQATLSGTAADDTIAQKTRSLFKTLVPASFKTADAIKSAKRVVSPYTTVLIATPSGVELEGFVPSEAARSALLAATKSRLPNRNVVDKLVIAGGEPSGYEACFTGAVTGLGRLGAGRIALSDRRVELSGETEDEALSSSLSGDVRRSLDGTCDAKVNVSYDDTKKRKAAEEAARVKREAENAERAKRENEAREASRREAELVEKAKLETQARQAAEAAAKQAQAQAAEVAAKQAQAKQAAEAAAQAGRLAANAPAAPPVVVAPVLPPKAAEPEVVKTGPNLDCEEKLRAARNEGAVLFERASDVIDKASRSTLRRLAQVANHCENMIIEIQGHTDSEGEPSRNQPLSERRAKSVVDYLVDIGVPASRLKSVGFGEQRPVAPNDTPEGRAKNRRIEFSVMDK